MAPKQTKRSRSPVAPDGTVSVRRVGLRTDPWRDLYHFLRTASWPALLASIVVVFLVTNALFALLYLLGAPNIANARSGSFADAFFFSVQTMATIGYGGMVPSTGWANILATAEAVFGIILTALSTGVLFAKLSTPRPRVLFSRYAVINQMQGVRTLMFRMGNARANHVIVEAEIRVTLIRDVKRGTAGIERQLFDLELKRWRTPFFALTWTAFHSIDEQSPLYQCSDESLERDNAALLITFTGIDDTLSTTVHTRYAYPYTHIRCGQKLRDVFLLDERGERYVDYRYFHDLEPADAQPGGGSAKGPDGAAAGGGAESGAGSTGGSE